MSARGCVVPLVVRLRGAPDDERLNEMSDAIARTVAGRLLAADRAIAAREGRSAWHKHTAAPVIRFTGAGFDEDLRRRVAAAIEAGIARATRGTHGAPFAAAPTPPGFVLAQFHPPAAAAASAEPDDGIRIARGADDAFWGFIRSQLFIHVINDEGVPERDEAIRTLMQGIRRERAQALIREALDRASSGVRFAMVLALGALRHDRTIAWRLLLYGLERPGDLIGHGPFEQALDDDSDAMIEFLGSVLAAPEEPYRTSAARVIRRYLEGQFAASAARHRHTYDRLRTLAVRHALYGSGPLGQDATRERIRRGIDLLVDTLPAIVDPLTPAAPRESSQTSDEHTLDGVGRALTVARAGLDSLAPDALAALDVRIAVMLEMAFVLPDRIGTIQRSIRGLARLLPSDDVPSDEIVVLQQLRHRFLQAFVNAPASDNAIDDFNAAESTFADMRRAVADVKFARLSREFDEARAAVGTADALHRTDGVDDLAFPAMSELLRGYTRAFVSLFTSHGVPGATIPVTITATAESLESATQIETDLALYKVLGSMFLLFSTALRYEHDMVEAEVSSREWRLGVAAELRAIRTRIVDFWNREDYQGFIGAFSDLRSRIEDIAVRINLGAQSDRDKRTAILLAATLVAGVAGLIVRAALIGVLLEASAGATRLAVAVTLTEATAFTATQLTLGHLAFGTPVTLRGAVTQLAVNVAQFAAFGALSRVLGPAGAAGQTWLQFIGRHAAGITLQIDIAALSLAVQGRGFPSDIGHFLIETIGGYAIGATTGYIGGQLGNAALQTRAREITEQGLDIRQRAEEAIRTGRFDEAAFNRLKEDLTAWFGRIRAVHAFMRDAGIMSRDEHDAALEVINRYTDGIAAAQYRRGATYGGPLLLEAGNVPGLVRAGPTEIYRYDPAHPPAQLGTLVRSYQRIASLSTTFDHGTLIVRELGSRRLVLLIGPGPIPAGLLTAPAPGAPPPHPLTFIESAAGPLTPAGLSAMTALLRRINPNAVTELETRGDVGIAALSLLIEHRTSLPPWPIAAIRGLATALELPRAITRASANRFFARSSEVAQIFETFGTVADMPGANLTFRQPSTQRTILLLSLYRELFASRIVLPDGMNESAHRGLLRMVVDLGRAAALEQIRSLAVDRRLAELIRNDPLTTPSPAVPALQQILDRHAGDLRPGINLGDGSRTPAQIRALIEQYATAHGGALDTHIPARIESTIAEYRAALRRVQDGIETDGRNVDGAREEFNALLLVLERGATVLSFSRMLGAAARDPFQAVVNVGWHPLRGRVTVSNAPAAAPVQIDVLSHGVSGIEIQEVAFSHLELPAPLAALATNTGPVTIDYGLLNDTTTHRKWKQIFKYIALSEFGAELTRAWGGSPVSTRIVVRARSATAPAQAALRNLGIDLEIIPP